MFSEYLYVPCTVSDKFASFVHTTVLQDGGDFYQFSRSGCGGPEKISMYLKITQL